VDDVIFIFIVEVVMAKKKTARIKVALVCTETGSTNYHTVVNKDKKPQHALMKYCPRLQKRTKHKIVEKLK